MGKRKRKKISGTLTWKTLRGFFRLLFQGIFKAGPLLLFGLAGFAVYWGIRANLYADPGFLVQEVRVSKGDNVSVGEVLVVISAD